MTPAEFFDKENGTTHALRSRQLCDSDRNILADLAGEADEKCSVDGCDEMLRPDHRGRFPFSIGDEPVCEEHYDAAYEEHLERKAEARAERRLGLQ